MGAIKILAYEPSHQQWFEKFNRDWIEKYIPIGIGEYKRSDVKMEINVSEFEEINFKL